MLCVETWCSLETSGVWLLLISYQYRYSLFYHSTKRQLCNWKHAHLFLSFVSLELKKASSSFFLTFSRYFVSLQLVYPCWLPDLYAWSCENIPAQGQLKLTKAHFPVSWINQSDPSSVGRTNATATLHCDYITNNKNKRCFLNCAFVRKTFLGRAES